MDTRPLVFGIGLPHSGGRILPALFEGNGHVWRHHVNGKLAVNAAYCQATDAIPFTKWPDAVGFSGLYRSNKRHLPQLQPGDLIAFLARHFPRAYFIHTHRDPADWITARYLADGGDHRTAAAWHARLSVAELADHWEKEHANHAAQCVAVLRGKRRFLDFNVTSDPIDRMCDFLRRDFTLMPDVALPDFTVIAEDMHSVVDQIAAVQPLRAAQPVDMNFVQQVVDFAIETPSEPGRIDALSANAVHWQSDTVFTTRTAEPAPMCKTHDGTVLIDTTSGWDRAQGALTELIAHGAKPRLTIDMMDARYVGSKGRHAAPARTVVYNRQIGAENLTLWPLPADHTLAPSGQPGGFPVDEIPFENKADRCVWLGTMTGRMSPVLTPKGRERRGVSNIRKQALDLTRTSQDWPDIVADLTCVPRYNIVKSLRNHPDFAVGLVLQDKWKQLAKSPAFVGMTAAERPRDWFYQFRYILSISGNDTGGNFLSAAASNALILKEEDGWELFYTEAFKPWVHYVPLAEGAQDAGEKLAWARAHPAESAKMARASTVMFERFANPNNRAAYLRAIAEGLNASG